MKRRILLLMMLACAVWGGDGAGAMAEEAPAWLRQAASTAHPPQGKEVKAIVLLDEGRRVVEDDGKATFTQLFAIKILSREGRHKAVARTIFNTDSERVREMRAWLIRPNGEVKRYGKEQMLETAVVDNDVYNESRKRTLSAADEADAGCVFGYEIITEERSVFSQFSWFFQDDIPVRLSRLTLAMPPGWRAENLTFNHAQVEPVVSGGTYTWEMRDLPLIEEEPGSPNNLVARLVVNTYPPEGKTTPLRAFPSWQDVSKFLSDLHDPQCYYNEAMEARARELAGAAANEFERIRAIGRYAQSVNYISIQTGIGRGGGYRPHHAAEVFAKNYGDCKDKANLMRAMLKALKIEAYPVSIFSGDPHFVRQEWPSPHQFNHCILAVKVGDEVKAPAVLEHPTLGRLMIFDPTDPYTPVGDLPLDQQGSYALLMAGEKGDLLRMPASPPEANLVERRIDATLAANGSLSARIVETSAGHAAARERARLRRASQQDYRQMIERWVTQAASGISVTRLQPADDDRTGRFTLEVEFESPAYAQTMQNRLLVFKPAVVSRRAAVPIASESRKQPVVLNAQAYEETVRIKLPEGFVVDEYPEAMELNQPFGNYAMSCEAKDGYLTFRRSFSLKGMMVSTDKYVALRDFYARILGAEQAPVVLMRK